MRRSAPTPLLFLLVLALSAASGRAQAQSNCDPSLPDHSTSTMAYRQRGDRCEGIYAQQVGTVTLEVRSLVRGFGPFDPAKSPHLTLEWQAPPNHSGDLHLRAFSFKPRTYFRMDTKLPSTRGLYRWPTDVLAGVGLGRDDLGVVAWIETPDSKVADVIYLPLKIIGNGLGDGATEIQATIVPSNRLQDLRISISRVDESGREVESLRHDQELGYGYYPSNQRIDFSLDEAKAPGYYRVKVAARPAVASRDLALAEFVFYNPQRSGSK